MGMLIREGQDTVLLFTGGNYQCHFAALVIARQSLNQFSQNAIIDKSIILTKINISMSTKYQIEMFRP